MIIYQPAFDVSHACFRMLQLLDGHPQKEMPIEQVRILDFYALFPHLLADVSLMPKHRAYKSELKKLNNRYNRVPNPRDLFFRMRGTQELALRNLASKGLLDGRAIRNAIAKRTLEPLPQLLQVTISAQDEDHQRIMRFIAVEVSAIPLFGGNGLKARTGLMEHRYDPA